jgi:outer membrane protein OmpA-like peptidoglycan-associated protein
MGGFDTRVRPPSPGLSPAGGLLPPIPDVKLPRPSWLGPEEGSATMDGFATGSATLTSGHLAELTGLAPRLLRLIDERPGGRVQVVGHTDRVGPDARNDRLGQQRADAVRDGLVAEGLDGGGIHTDSLGEQVPAVGAALRAAVQLEIPF